MMELDTVSSSGSASSSAPLSGGNHGSRTNRAMVWVAIAAGLLGVLAMAAWIVNVCTTHDFATQNSMEMAKTSTTPFPPAQSNAGLDSNFEVLGCYPLDIADSVETPSLYDETCVQAYLNGVCRSGLPFYRMSILSQGGARGTMTWQHCASFCFFKGLDVSGVVDAIECRCGATPENADVWGSAGPGSTRSSLSSAPAVPPRLRWQPKENEVQANDQRCRIIAARYLGALPISQGFDSTSQDISYIKSVVAGRKIEPLERLEPPALYGSKAGWRPFRGPAAAATNNAAAAAAAAATAVGQSIGGPLQLRTLVAGQEGQPPLIGPRPPGLPSCYPHRCAPGWPWPIWSTMRKTGIPFAFADSTDAATQKVFRDAIEVLHRMTCIRFNQVSVYYNDTYKILVRGDQPSCHSTGTGYPAAAQRQDLEINLGWCKTEAQRGAMLHELCHALGMGHEQSRPDRDSFVVVNWQTLPNEEMRQQFMKLDTAFVGSTETGNVSYDFDSIMHYPADESMHTLPELHGHGVHDSQVGQRKRLSAQDVLQLRDMYACDRSTPIGCVDDDEGVMTLFDPPATCQQAKSYCTRAEVGADVRYFCPYTCNACPSEPAVPMPNADIEGCKDKNEDLCILLQDYCPGRLSGHEQWMTANCRATCWLEYFCGPTTSGNPTTKRPKEEPPLQGDDERRRTIDMLISLEGNGYDLQRQTDKIVLADSITRRFEKLFGTGARVSIDGSSQTDIPTRVTLDCGCNPYAGLPCSISCSELRHKMMSFTVSGSSLLNEQFAEGGLSGVQVKNTWMEAKRDRIRALLMNPLLATVALVVGVASLTGAITCLCHAHCCKRRSDADYYHTMTSED